MSKECIAAVVKVAGKPVSAAKIAAIEDRISAKMRELARRDREAWLGMSRDQRVATAAASAMEDLKAEAALKEHRAMLQVARAAETDSRIVAQTKLGTKITRSQALIRDIEQTGHYIDALRNDAISSLRDMIDAAESKDGTGLLRNLGMRLFDLDNPAMTADVVREIFRNADGSTGNKAATAAARAWLDTIEKMRTRFNAAGGDVGKLVYGYLGQTHDMIRVAKITAKAWAEKVLPLLDRQRYLREDGSLATNAEMLAMLEAAHETIATGGANKTEPGQFRGTGARANHGSEHRVLHFKDGDAWMSYMGEFGEGSLYDAMMGHVRGMSRDIGLVERYGPNPEAQFRVQADIAERSDGAGTAANRSAGNTPEGYWNVVAGKAGMQQNRFAAAVGQNVRNVQTAAKLGGAVLTSFTDVGTVASTLHFNRLPYFDMLRNVGKQFDGETRDFLQAHGIIGESMASTLNRWTGDNMTHSLTGRAAASVMKLSLLNAWTDGLRNAFSMTMMGGLARMAKKSWDGLDDWDRYLLGRHGITESDWATVQRAQADDLNGYAMLTADAIRKTGADNADQVATRILSYVLDESQFAVINPDVATRAIVTGGGMPAGTIRGEAMRSFMQFKSFPIAMLTRHWRRVLETPQGLQGAPSAYGAKTAVGGVANRVSTLAALNVTLMMLGAIVLQTKGLVQGKDPYDMTESKFWMRALSQGGGVGYIGDLLFKDPTESRPGTAEQTIGSVLGPSAGAVAGLAGDLVVTNLWEAAKGKDTHFGAEALRWINSQLPGTSLWWARGIWEHSFLFWAQEMLSPGYLARMKARAQKDWGQGYWWEPGQALPDRAPEFSNAVGK